MIMDILKEFMGGSDNDSAEAEESSQSPQVTVQQPWQSMAPWGPGTGNPPQKEAAEEPKRGLFSFLKPSKPKQAARTPAKSPMGSGRAPIGSQRARPNQQYANPMRPNRQPQHMAQMPMMSRPIPRQGRPPGQNQPLFPNRQPFANPPGRVPQRTNQMMGGYSPTFAPLPPRQNNMPVRRPPQRLRSQAPRPWF